ncbi:MAG: hypothetical protein ACR2J8_06195, partial [Thermomicrobiales bacterium]
SVAVVDHALMGVLIPAGAREIVLRYEPRSLRIGLLVTVATIGASVLIWLLNLWNLLRGDRGLRDRSNRT